MPLQAWPAAVEVAAASLRFAKSSNGSKCKITESRGRKRHFRCLTGNKRITSNKNKLYNSVCSILLGAADSVLTRNAQIKNPIIARHLRRWQACRRRRKRRKSGRERRYQCNSSNNKEKYNKTSSSGTRRISLINERTLRNYATSSDRSNNSNKKSNNHTTETKQSLLFANYTACGLLQARNSNWPQADAKALELVECHATESNHCVCTAAAARATTTTTTKLMSKLVKCERLTSRRKSEQQSQLKLQQKQPQQQQQLAEQRAPTDAYWPASQPQIQKQAQLVEQDHLVATNELQARLQADIEHTRLMADGVGKGGAGMQWDQLEWRTQMQQQQQQQQHSEQQHCLPTPTLAKVQQQQRQASKEIVHQRSWQNLIGCVASDTNAIHTFTATTTTTTTTSKAPATPTNAVLPHRVAPKKLATTKATCSPVERAVKATAQMAITSATKTTKTTKPTILKVTMPSQQHVSSSVSARKSKCRRTFALTSALKIATATMATTKKITITKVAKSSTRLAKSRASAALFADILTLFVGALTLHATVLRCVLITAMASTTASATAAPFLPQNTHQLLLSQQTLQKLHFHNGSNNGNSSNNNNNNHPHSISNISTFTSASANNNNHRHSLLPTATPQPPPLPPPPAHFYTPPSASLRLMDIEVLNGNSSSTSTNNNFESIIGDGHANTLKSLSSIREASVAGDGVDGVVDVNQLPIFDFGLPRNITARTGQAEATIKCRVERLDDKSVSWIRKRDLHILTVATATYTSDKRFQVTSSKDGREWILHVKSPQARDSGIYECQVNTEPKMSMAFQLNIIEIPADSRAIISGPADLHFKVGSAIILNCHVQQPSVRDIGPIYWYRGDHIITPFEVDDTDDDGAEKSNRNGRHGHNDDVALQQQYTPALSNNELDVDVTATITNANGLAAAMSRGSEVYAGSAGSAAGVVGAAAVMQHDGLTNDITPDFTARIAMESQLGDTMKSRLRISNAQTTDTGNYTCQPTTASSASVMVHVINDENPAAMQKSSASSMRTTTATTMRCGTNMMLMLLVAATTIKTIMTKANVITSTTMPAKPATQATVAKTKATMSIFDYLLLLSQKQAVNCQQQQQHEEKNQHQQ